MNEQIEFLQWNYIHKQESIKKFIKYQQVLQPAILLLVKYNILNGLLWKTKWGKNILCVHVSSCYSRLILFLEKPNQYFPEVAFNSEILIVVYDIHLWNEKIIPLPLII